MLIMKMEILFEYWMILCYNITRLEVSTTLYLCPKILKLTDYLFSSFFSV